MPQAKWREKGRSIKCSEYSFNNLLKKKEVMTINVNSIKKRFSCYCFHLWGKLGTVSSPQKMRKNVEGILTNANISCMQKQVGLQFFGFDGWE